MSSSPGRFPTFSQPDAKAPSRRPAPRRGLVVAAAVMAWSLALALPAGLAAKPSSPGSTGNPSQPQAGGPPPGQLGSGTKPAKPASPARPPKPAKPAKPATPTGSTGNPSSSSSGNSSSSSRGHSESSSRGSSSSSGKPASNPSAPSSSAKGGAPNSNSRGASHGKPSATGGGGKGVGTQGHDGGNRGGGGNPGKTTICHATASETNPFVGITVANPSLRAHGAHQNDEDIIPAAGEECPNPFANVFTDTPATTPATPLPLAPPTDADNILLRPGGAAPIAGTVDGAGGNPAAANQPGTALAVVGREPAAPATLAADGAEADAATGTASPSGDDGDGSALPVTGEHLLAMALVGFLTVLSGRMLSQALARRRRPMTM